MAYPALLVDMDALYPLLLLKVRLSRGVSTNALTQFLGSLCA